MTEPARDQTSSRHAAVTRREWFRRVALLGAAAVFPGLAGCTNDASVLGNATIPPQTAGSSTTQPKPSSSPTTSPSSTTAMDVSTTFPADGEVVVRFTYAPTLSNTANPYIAVWFEDADGNWVDTIALWFMQNQEGLEYLRDLRRWQRVDGTSGTVDTISSATRRPGDYAVVWDGRTADGSPVKKGDYFVCIESAREDGPYSLIREPIHLEDEPFAVVLSDSGELAGAAVDFHRG